MFASDHPLPESIRNLHPNDPLRQLFVHCRAIHQAAARRLAAFWILAAVFLAGVVADVVWLIVTGRF